MNVRVRAQMHSLLCVVNFDADILAPLLARSASVPHMYRSVCADPLFTLCSANRQLVDLCVDFMFLVRLHVRHQFVKTIGVCA